MKKSLFLLLFLAVFLLQAQEQTKMKEFFGVNTSVGENTDRVSDVRDVVGWIRNYRRWEMFEPENDQYDFTGKYNPMNFDSLYQHINDLGINTLMVVMKAPKWISSSDSEDYSRYAPSGDQSGLDPEHYQEAAEFYYQLAARYGSKNIDPSKLETEDKKSGMNVLGSISVMNEADGAYEWGNRIEWEQYAALLNAVYDGNDGKMGSGYGVKDADPDLPVSVTGLAFNLKSLISLKKLTGRIPYDVINVHFYAFRYARPSHRVAVPPEWSSLVDDMKEIIAWRNKEAPGRPVWLTEIGWDSQDFSTEGVTEEEAASYLIRSMMLLKGAGVDKGFWFYYHDFEQNRKGVFATSGLFRNTSIPYSGSTQLEPKRTYWYYGTMTKRIGDLYYDQNLSDSTTYHYSFKDETKSKEVHVLWYCPTYFYKWRQLVDYPDSASYAFTIPGNARNIQVIRPAGGSFDGVPYPNKVRGNKISLDLTGTPVFVEYELD